MDTRPHLGLGGVKCLVQCQQFDFIREGQAGADRGR